MMCRVFKTYTQKGEKTPRKCSLIFGPTDSETPTNLNLGSVQWIPGGWLLSGRLGSVGHIERPAKLTQTSCHLEVHPCD